MAAIRVTTFATRTAHRGSGLRRVPDRASEDAALVANGERRSVYRSVPGKIGGGGTVRQHDIADRVSALVPVFACLLLLPSLGGAQPTATQNDLRRCAELVNEADRRACLDWVTRALRRDGGAREPPEEATDTAGPREATPPDENRDVDAFGAELIGGGAARGPDEIRSRLVGEFTGWRGNTEFTLENGQVWRQAERDRMIFSADAPIVTIRRGAFNAYRLTVEGVRRSIRVRRVR